MNNRKRMYSSNAMARQWLLDNNYDNIWLKRHTKRKDLVFTQKGNYLATDLWNLFDGICTLGNKILFLQLKTNSWPKAEPLHEFSKKYSIPILVINVTNKLKACKGRFKVFVRLYL